MVIILLFDPRFQHITKMTLAIHSTSNIFHFKYYFSDSETEGNNMKT